MITGRYEHQIDENNRIRIPVKFKEALGGPLVIMKGSDRCLLVLTEQQAEEVMRKKFEKQISGDYSDSNRVRLMRKTMSETQQVTEDKQGRVSLDSELVDYAGIQKNIVTIGAFDKIEIWSAEKWKEYSEQLDDESYDENMKNI